ncbi:hypothetical protein ACFZCY_11260 [Streptomyces sp. NPDC007983]|uniref:hypothetical protein n=1 Tax=Streptomyces sp. NPDC007983 TaxID=3364800 RepID=UPI0036E19A7C
MSDDAISQLLNILPALLALTFGARIGYVLANRGTARDIEMIERHFENGLALTKQQHDMQLEADRRRRIREEMKENYDSLAIWLHELERTFDEIRAGALSSNGDTKRKATAIIDQRPWEVVNTPTEMASCKFYWSADTRKILRKFLGPYAKFISQARSMMEKNSESDREQHITFDMELWQSHDELISLINEVRDQMRSDLEELK